MRGVIGKNSTDIGLKAGDLTHVVIIMRPSTVTDCGATNQYIPFETAELQTPLAAWSNVQGLREPDLFDDGFTMPIFGGGGEPQIVQQDSPDAPTHPVFGGAARIVPVRRRAAIEHLSTTAITSDQINGQVVSTQIRLAYVPGITTEMRVRHLIERENRLARYVDYAIDGVIDIDEKQRHMVLRCTRVQESPVVA